MRLFWWQIRLVVLTILFDQFIPLSLLITTTLMLSWFSSYRLAVPLIAFLGLIDDLTQARLMGITSIVLVLLSGLVLGLKEQFSQRAVSILIGVAIIAELLWQIWRVGEVSVLWVMLQGLVCGVLWWLIGSVRVGKGMYLR